MKLYHHFEELLRLNGRSDRVVAIGNFDGVHLGHREVISAGIAQACAAELDFAICTFDPHPARFFSPTSPELALSTPDTKYALLASCGVPLVLAQRFDQAFSELSPGEFARLVLKEALHARRILVGADFRFGRGRDGNVGALKKLGPALGFEVSPVPLLSVGGIPISSSRIRALILAGDMSSAQEMLGRPHEIGGVVVRGKGAGTGLGFPTVNIQSTGVLIPPAGIYAAECVMDDRCVPAAAYVGHRPTLGHGYSVEAHLLDFHGDLYDRPVVLRFLQRLRGDIHFKDTDELRAQIDRDVAAVRQIARQC